MVYIYCGIIPHVNTFTNIMFGFMKVIKNHNTRAISISFPNDLLEEVDIICKINYLSRSSWLIAAAREKLATERAKKIERLKLEAKLGD